MGEGDARDNTNNSFTVRALIKQVHRVLNNNKITVKSRKNRKINKNAKYLALK